MSSVSDLRARSTEKLQGLAERGFGALLAFDERMVNRADPAVDAALDPFDAPWAERFVAGWADVRAELDAMLDAGVVLPETNDLVESDQGAEGRWTTYVMHWYGQWVEENSRRCPNTTELLRSVPGLQVGGFTVLGPHTHIPGHQGPAKSLRWQLGVRIPEPVGSSRLRVGDEVVVWQDGACLAFDDRSDHEAWNDADEPRYVLFVQVAWPVDGWVGTLHRGTHWVFGRATRRIAGRAAELDAKLNAN